MTFDKTTMAFNGSYQENGNAFSFELDMDIIQMLDGTIVFDINQFFKDLHKQVNRASYEEKYTLYQLLYKFSVHKYLLDKAFENTDCVDKKILLNYLNNTRYNTSINPSSGVNATLVQYNNSSNGDGTNAFDLKAIYCFYDKDEYDKKKDKPEKLRKKHPLLLDIYPVSLLKC